MSKAKEVKEKLEGTCCPLCGQINFRAVTEGQNYLGWVQCFNCVTKMPIQTWMQYQPTKEKQDATSGSIHQPE